MRLLRFQFYIRISFGERERDVGKENGQREGGREFEWEREEDTNREGNET